MVHGEREVVEGADPDWAANVLMVSDLVDAAGAWAYLPA
jgi:hypothetical protein